MNACSVSVTESNNCSSSKQATAMGPEMYSSSWETTQTLNQLLSPPYRVDSSPLGGKRCSGQTKFEMTLCFEQTT
jgi:hypothetical protein